MACAKCICKIVVINDFRGKLFHGFFINFNKLLAYEKSDFQHVNHAFSDSGSTGAVR